jgi:mannan endo-1,4-beta-mannosidase
MRLELLSAAGLLAAGAAARCVPKGFVTTKGTEFYLDGKPFRFAGSNAYYFPFNNVSSISTEWEFRANVCSEPSRC